MRVSLLVLCVGWVGCATPPASVPSPPAASAADVACAERDGIVLKTHDITLVCGTDYRACTGVAAFELSNCGAEPLQVVGLHVYRGDERATSLHPWNDALAPGTHRSTQRYEHLRAGHYTLRAELETDGKRTMTDGIPFAVHDRSMDDARAACSACHGVWGRRGPGPDETCNCGTPDGGVFCDDGNDCTGECHFERFEEVRPATPACSDCTVSLPALGRPVGTCSAHQVSRGCRARIPDGASSHAPVRLPAEPAVECGP